MIEIDQLSRSARPQKTPVSPKRAFFLFLGFFCLSLGFGGFHLAAASRIPDSRKDGLTTARDETGIRNPRSGGRRKQEKAKDQGKEKTGKGGKSTKTGGDTGNELFLPEVAENQGYLPDIYRCPECGYEQDEAGNCPDHSDIELVKVMSKDRNPLEPTEYDGNEDLLVDIPITGLVLRKTAPGVASSPAGLPPQGTP